MSSFPPIDLIPLERRLHELVSSIRETNTDESWDSVEKSARELANSLRVRNATGECQSLSMPQAPALTTQSCIVDSHTILGKTELPQTLTSLLSLALNGPLSVEESGAHVPKDNRTGPVLELLRVGANICMDHSE